MSEYKPSRLHRFQDRLKIAIQGGSKIDIPFLLESAAHLREPEEIVKWLEQLVLWIRLSGGSGTSRQTSLKFLFSRLEQNAAWKESFVQVLRSLLLNSDYMHLFSDTGVHSNFDFLREGTTRFLKSFFPAFGDPSDMETVIDRVFCEEEDSNWVESLSVTQKQQITAWIFSDPEFVKKLNERLIGNALEASKFLCVRASALSIQRELMERAGCARPMEIPTLRLSWHLEDFFADVLLNKTNGEVNESYQKVIDEISNSRKYLENVHSHLELFGVSVRLVFSLESIGSILDRLEQLTLLCHWLRYPEDRFYPWVLFRDLIRDSWTERQLSPLLKSNFRLLSRKIVEKSGATGEEYITETRRGYLAMFYAALGGGFITAFTSLAKHLGPHQGAPFLLGLYAALNYSFCFMLMHHLHFKLATKQPAMTAAALAQRLRSTTGATDTSLDDFVGLVARISRSQFAAVAGNIIAVIPCAFAIDFLFTKFTGNHIIDSDHALTTLQSFNPFSSLTVFYGALTGGLLWLAGLISGWIENSFVYFRAALALQSHPFLINLLGEHRLESLVNWIKRNLTGWSSSISLGFLLAFFPVAGKFFGLPLDVRHVTLTTGSASYSISSLWAANLDMNLVIIALGILLIGVMNFGVSFALALHIAVRANDIPRRRLTEILRACGRELIHKPAKFFFPPSQ